MNLDRYNQNGRTGISEKDPMLASVDIEATFLAKIVSIEDQKVVDDCDHVDKYICL